MITQNGFNTDVRLRSRNTLLDALLMGIGTFVLAAGFKLLTSSQANVSGLWLANGFGLGMLLTVPGSRWPLLLAVNLVGGVCSGLYMRVPTSMVLWISLFCTLEIAVAAMPLASKIAAIRDLTQRRKFLSFLLWAILVAPLSLVAMLIVFDELSGRPFNLVMLSRLAVGHLLGFAVMLPVTLALRSGEIRRFVTPPVLPEALLMLVLVGGTATAVFLQSNVSLLFLIIPPLVRVAYRGGYSGTALALLLLLLIGTVATGTGHGPIAALSALPDHARQPILGDSFIMLQMLMATLLLSLFPMIVSLAEGRRAHRVTEELQNRLRLLMEHSSDVILLTDLQGRMLFVSPAVRDVIGHDPHRFLSTTWRDHICEEDLLLVGSQFEEAYRTRASRSFVFRARHSSGRTIWLEAHQRYFRDAAFALMSTEKERGMTADCGREGDEGFVVTLRDITARREAELALEQANAELATLVRKDALTGLANRRHFDEVLSTSWTRARSGGWPIAVLMIDVDHFKQFNDCYGHQRGDACLREVACAISDGLFHTDDLVARYGGEEFAVILPRTNIDNAMSVAERIRQAVMDLQWPHASAPLGIVTVSVGVAAASPIPGGSPEAVVTAADEALYASKSGGRNRTTLMEVDWPRGNAASR
jgi:diguanylate cyclase (GGDEF)-like protein/PAS domain S-box-containing protein